MEVEWYVARPKSLFQMPCFCWFLLVCLRLLESTWSTRQIDPGLLTNIIAFEKKAKRHQLCICYTHQGSLQVSDTILNISTWKNKGNLYTFPFPGAFFLFSCPGLLTGFFDSFVLPVMVSIGPYRCVPLKVEKTVWTVWTAWTMKE